MSKRKTTEEFIKDAIRIHEQKYDYSLVKYINNQIKIKIICKEHGEFLQSPNAHLSPQNCPICNIFNSIQRHTLTTEEFIQKAISIHSNKYDYSLVKYIGSNKKVKIICKEHGEFLQSPNSHLVGQGCSSCVGLSIPTTEEFIQKAVIVHGDRYDYSLVNYVNAKTKIKIICQKHKEFKQVPNSHLKGHGCPSCAITGFDKNKPAYFYYIRFNELYKIGITNIKVKKRIQTMQVSKFYQSKILQEIYFENGIDALDLETKTKQQFKEFQYHGDKIMTNGNTELFVKDILGLDI